ncbi:MAG: MFS transporter [Bacteroidetes bacterium]|nr:MFS transporter [Bacteroidota bacterium]
MSNWRIKVSLFVNYFVFAMLLNSSGIAITQVQNNFKVSSSAASWIDPCKDFSIAILSFIVASFIIKLGYRFAMLIALAVVASACFIIPSIPGFFAIKILFVIVGASFALIKISVYSTIGIVTGDSKEHIRFMNFIESFFTVGNIVLYIVFSLFIDNAHPESTEWLKSYYLIGGLAVFAFLLLLSSKLDESGVKKVSGEDDLNFFGMFILMAKPVIVAFLCGAFFYVLIEQSIQNFLPTFNQKVLHLPNALSIQMGIILAGSYAVGRFLAGIVLKKIHWFYVLAACLLLAAGMILVAMPLAKNVTFKTDTDWFNAPLAAYIFPLIGLFLAPIYPSINSAVLSSLPKEKQGLMSGLIIVFSAVGGTAGSLLTGAIFDAYDGQTAFYFTLVPISILMICLFAFNKLQKKTIAAKENA